MRYSYVAEGAGALIMLINVILPPFNATWFIGGTIWFIGGVIIYYLEEITDRLKSWDIKP